MPTISARARLSLAAAGLAIAPILFIARQAIASFRNAPFEDEFGTVLDFLLRYRDTHTLRGLIALLFDQSNEHRIVTSRLIFIALNALTGGANFVVIAVLGNLFVVGAILTIAWQEREPAARWILAATLSLLIFQMQHYENLFLSYASIDHFHVVLLAAASLALLTRASWKTECGALVLAVLASFTLVHGLAVFPAGAILLIHQKRRRGLVLWSLCALAVTVAYLWGLEGPGRPLPVFLTWSGAVTMARYWLALLGGVPALGAAALAPWFGALALAAYAWFVFRGGFKREPFFCALLTWIVISTILIAYGRFTVSSVPPLSSRYMIQSAVLWGVLGFIGLKSGAAKEALALRGLALLGSAAVLSVAADSLFFERAHIFIARRNAAIDYYERRGSLEGSPYSIYPDPAVADRLLAATRKSHLFQLEPRSSPEVRLSVRSTQDHLDNSIDEITVGTTHVFIRGWLLPPLGQFTNYQPHLILQGAGKQFVFKGDRVKRPDVAKIFQRPYADGCGFSFNIPREALPPTDLRVRLALVGWGGALTTEVVGHFFNGPPTLAQR